jgi:hypothetical protein
MNIAVACAGTKTIGIDRLGPSVHFVDLRPPGANRASKWQSNPMKGEGFNADD